MSYLNKEKSNFIPILMGLSIVTVIGFGVMFFTFGKSLSDSASTDDANRATTSPSAAVQSLSKTSHTHV